mgnify:FL=1
MALIHCPECSREISDKAESCPGCGFVLTKDDLPKVRKSDLSEIKKNPAIGTLCIIIGIIAILGGIPFISIIIGIFAIIGGFIFIGMGMNNISGTQTGNCPYCNHSITVGAKAATFKCPHCKKISTRNSNQLEAID